MQDQHFSVSFAEMVDMISRHKGFLAGMLVLSFFARIAGLGWSGLVEDVVQIFDYLLVAAGLSHVLADSVDIVSDLFVCQDHRGCTPQRLPVDLFAPHHRSRPELCDSRPYRRLIVGHGDHHHRHLIIEGFVDAVHAAMRYEQVSLLKDGQLIYRLVDEYVMRNPGNFIWSKLRPTESTTVTSLSPNAATTAW